MMKYSILFLTLLSCLWISQHDLMAQEEESKQEKVAEKRVKIVTVQPDGSTEVEEFNFNTDHDIDEIVDKATEGRVKTLEKAIKVYIEEGENSNEAKVKVIKEIQSAPSKAKKLGMGLIFDERYKNNLIVRHILSDSPAKESGLQEGDVILEIDGDEVNQFKDLVETLSGRESGDQLDVEFLRYGKKMKVKLTLREIQFTEKQYTKKQRRNFMPELRWGEHQGVRLGVFLRESLEGLEVEKVIPNSLAEQLGIKPNDIIEELNNQPIEAIGDLKETLRNLQEGDDIELKIKRGQKKVLEIKGKI